ncbi:TIGR03943 family putative permease subunit [Anaeropeptidivorans aminofermentans]|jgi:putative membrane protein|uniref:TIGR03943 family putative permease subunit n=1 Tax=Anaeropeptidivorans aminofermentans TaxID=2934315 RepID=UPI002025B413|nr:TIGR03943 family protein [Anaeropeptidivorans aminofermentans]
MEIKLRAFNPQIFLEILCYSIFGGLMIYLVKSGKYLNYVTPKMAPYLYFSAFIMAIWSFSSIRRLFLTKYKIRSMHCMVLAIPALLILLPHQALGASDFLGNYISVASFLSNQGENIFKKVELLGNTLSSTQPDIYENEPSGALPGLDPENKRITLSDDNFFLWMNVLYADMKTYEGYTLITTGFIYKDPKIVKENEFVPARLAMTCCVADLVPMGLICRYNKASELNPEEWVTVEGIIFTGTYEFGGKIYEEPQLEVIRITPAKPLEGYVYPY